MIELRSDLGGGKTTFVKGLAKGAGCSATVNSPTFTLSRIYPAKDFQIYHFDFYRLAEPGILAEQLAEAVNDKSSVVVVEWADIVEDVLPTSRISIQFRPTGNSSEIREIVVKYPASKQSIFSRVESDWQESKP